MTIAATASDDGQANVAVRLKPLPVTLPRDTTDNKSQL
jgi:hypothetical protein